MALFSGTVSAQISTVFSSALAVQSSLRPRCCFLRGLSIPAFCWFNCSAALGSVAAARAPSVTVLRHAPTLAHAIKSKAMLGVISRRNPAAALAHFLF